jgi:hypothetical protein
MPRAWPVLFIFGWNGCFYRVQIWLWDGNSCFYLSINVEHRLVPCTCFYLSINVEHRLVPCTCTPIPTHLQHAHITIIILIKMKDFGNEYLLHMFIICSKWPLDPCLHFLNFTKCQSSSSNSKPFVGNHNLKISLAMFNFRSFYCSI